MNQETFSPSVHVPLAIIALAFALFIGTQIGAAKQSNDFLHWQIETARKSLERLKVQETQYAEALKDRENGVEQSKQLQAKLQMLLNDLLDLAETDDDARRVIQKWDVKRNAN